MPVSGDVLRCWRRARGWDVPEMARRLRKAARGAPVADHEALVRMIRYWESGRRRLTERYELLYASALGVGADVMADGPGGNGFSAGSELSSAAGPDGADRLAWTLQHPRRVDQAAVDSLAGILAAQRHAEDVLGAAAMVAPVMVQLTSIEGLVIEARGPVRPALVDVAGQWAQFAGWLHASAKREASASRLYDRALEWATEAGDVNLISEVVSMKGHLAWMAGAVGPVIGLSQAAQRDTGAFSGQHAISAAQEARGHAMAGDAAAAERKLAIALEKAHQAASNREEAPPWLYYHSPAFFELQRGLVYRFLARERRYKGKAVMALRNGHAALPVDEQSSDWGAVFLYHLAAVYAQDGDIEQTCTVALNVARIARQTGSVRLAAMLADLHGHLAHRWPDRQRVAELGEALR